jgi:hypothetical protein
MRNCAGRDHILHALGATSPVTVVEVQLLALQDKCAKAILEKSAFVPPYTGKLGI